MTVLDIRSITLSAPRRGSLNPLPQLRLLGDLHDDIDCTGLDMEMTRNIRYGNVSSVLPYLLQDDYSRELVPQKTSVATLENDDLLADIRFALRGLDPWPPKGQARPSEDYARQGWQIARPTPKQGHSTP